MKRWIKIFENIFVSVAFAEMGDIIRVWKYWTCTPKILRRYGTIDVLLSLSPMPGNMDVHSQI